MNDDLQAACLSDSESHFVHVVLTRFNVRTEFNSGAVLRSDWLEHRFGLFDKFAFPSMRNQVCGNFVWLIFFDVRTPLPFRERIKTYANSFRNIQPVYVDGIKIGTQEVTTILRSLIKPIFAPNTTHLISTRFDNDDAVSEDFISTIQQQFNGQEFEFINLSNGYLWHKNRLYTKRNLSNPFISLIESVSDFRTVWCAGHHRLKSYGDIRQVDSSPQWMQVIHGRNVSNRVRVGNVRLPLDSLPASFHFGFSYAPHRESLFAIKIENQIKFQIKRFRWRWSQFWKKHLER